MDEKQVMQKPTPKAMPPPLAPKPPVESKVVMELSEIEAVDLYNVIQGSAEMEEFNKMNDVIAKGDSLVRFSNVLADKIKIIQQKKV